MRQLTTTQENLHTKEQSINQLEARYLELEAQLAELQTECSAKDDSIQYLQNEKIVLEVALQAARADKSQLDESAERLGEDVLVASDVLDQLRQEVQVKASQVWKKWIHQLNHNIFFLSFLTSPQIWRRNVSAWLQIETLQQENSSLKKQAQKLKEQFQQQKVNPALGTVHKLLAVVKLVEGREKSRFVYMRMQQPTQADAGVGGCIVAPDGCRLRRMSDGSSSAGCCLIRIDRLS